MLRDPFIDPFASHGHPGGDKPKKPATPARAAPAITPIPLNDIPNPVDERTAAVTPVRADDP